MNEWTSLKVLSFHSPLHTEEDHEIRIVGTTLA